MRRAEGCAAVQEVARGVVQADEGRLRFLIGAAEALARGRIERTADTKGLRRYPQLGDVVGLSKAGENVGSDYNWSEDPLHPGEEGCVTLSPGSGTWRQQDSVDGIQVRVRGPRGDADWYSVRHVVPRPSQPEQPPHDLHYASAAARAVRRAMRSGAVMLAEMAARGALCAAERSTAAAGAAPLLIKLSDVARCSLAAGECAARAVLEAAACRRQELRKLLRQEADRRQSVELEGSSARQSIAEECAAGRNGRRAPTRLTWGASEAIPVHSRESSRQGLGRRSSSLARLCSVSGSQRSLSVLAEEIERGGELGGEREVQVNRDAPPTAAPATPQLQLTTPSQPGLPQSRPGSSLELLQSISRSPRVGLAALAGSVDSAQLAAAREAAKREAARQRWAAVKIQKVMRQHIARNISYMVQEFLWSEERDARREQLDAERWERQVLLSSGRARRERALQLQHAREHPASDDAGRPNRSPVSDLSPKPFAMKRLALPAQRVAGFSHASERDAVVAEAAGLLQEAANLLSAAGPDPRRALTSAELAERCGLQAAEAEARAHIAVLAAARMQAAEREAAVGRLLRDSGGMLSACAGNAVSIDPAEAAYVLENCAALLQTPYLPSLFHELGFVVKRAALRLRASPPTLRGSPRRELPSLLPPKEQPQPPAPAGTTPARSLGTPTAAVPATPCSPIPPASGSPIPPAPGSPISPAPGSPTPVTGSPVSSVPGSPTPPAPQTPASNAPSSPAQRRRSGTGSTAVPSPAAPASPAPPSPVSPTPAPLHISTPTAGLPPVDRPQSPGEVSWASSPRPTPAFQRAKAEFCVEEDAMRSSHERAEQAERAAALRRLDQHRGRTHTSIADALCYLEGEEERSKRKAVASEELRQRGAVAQGWLRRLLPPPRSPGSSAALSSPPTSPNPGPATSPEARPGLPRSGPGPVQPPPRIPSMSAARLAKPEAVAVHETRTDPESGRCLHVINFRFHGAHREAARFYNDFCKLREENKALGALTAPFPGKTLQKCTGAKLEERRAKLSLWIWQAVDECWPNPALARFLDVTEGWDPAAASATASASASASASATPRTLGASRSQGSSRLILSQQS